MSDTTTYQIEIISFNPDKLPVVMQKMPELLAANLPGKLGGRLVGKFMAELGANFQLMLVLEYDNLQNRLDAQERLAVDPFRVELGKFLGEVAKDVEVWFVKAAPQHKPSFPVRGRLLMRRYDFKGLITDAMHDFMKSTDMVIKKHATPSGVNLAGAFVPIIGKHTNCCFMLWDLPKEKTIDEHISMVQKIMHDDSLRSAQQATGTHLIDVYSVLWQPLP